MVHYRCEFAPVSPSTSDRLTMVCSLSMLEQGFVGKSNRSQMLSFGLRAKYQTGIATTVIKWPKYHMLVSLPEYDRSRS